MSLTITEGTQTDIYTVVNAGTEITVVKLDAGVGTALSDWGGTIPTVANLNNGTVRISVGTITTGTLQNLVSGTINALAAGTIAGGTIQNLNAGTVAINAVPVTIGTSYGTLGTTGAAVWGTLVATAGAGTRQYVSGVAIVVASGTVDCAITNVGTVAAANGVGILARGQFTPGGGIAQTFDPVEASGAAGTLAFWLGGAGTAYFRVSYWQGV